jgi:hypothetical protein
MATKEEILKALKEGKVKSAKMPMVGDGEGAKKSAMRYEGTEEDFKKNRSAKMPMFPKENSVEQYIQEKKAGAALSDLSYDEWKKL